MKALFRVMALGLLIALASCQFPHEVPRTATATNDAETEVSSGLLRSGDTVVYLVRVPSAVANQGPLLYLELEAINTEARIEITAHDLLGNPYARSRSSEYFFDPAGTLAMAGEPSLTAQTIAPTVSCRGPCILQPARMGVIRLEVRNASIHDTRYNLYAFAEAFWDVNEPGNDTEQGAVVIPVGGTVQGALETLGDVDYFVTAGPVRSVRITSVPTNTVEPTAVLSDFVTGARISTITAGASAYFETPKRVLIQVSSGNDLAGPSGSSFYNITTTP